MIASITLISPAFAVDLLTKPYLTLGAARSVMSAAEKEAAAHGWPCGISVVDAEALPTLTLRTNNASVSAGVEFTPGIARRAALFRGESGTLAINGTRPAAITVCGFVLRRGVVPITVNGTVVGAVGVSTDTPDHDQRIAKAGTTALTRK
ncbi:GlcG/HbpS family heme-binding protein [Brucella oryzae]|nr:heme-binding protein [Brucella oryzae]